MNSFKRNIFRTETTNFESYPYYLSTSTSASSSGVCPYPYNLTLYSNTSSLVIASSVLYTDTGLTTVFAGSSLYRRISLSTSYGKSINISNSGVVLSIADTCYPAYFLINVSNSTGTSNCQGAGATTYPIALYVQNIPVILGTIFYTNTSLTTTFTGDGTWYNVSNTLSYRINASGVVTQIDNSCAPPE
jgi:hypothetical protein